MHANVFEDEAGFLLHFERAMAIARRPANHIRAHDGEDLLGVPQPRAAAGPDELEGPVRWITPPRRGEIPTADPEVFDLDYLAPHLQSILLTAAPLYALRITPEVRVERVSPIELMAVRTLSVELSIAADASLSDRHQDALGETFRPYLRRWYPLHAELACEIVISKRPTRAQTPTGMVPVRALLYRYRAPHHSVLNG